MKYFAYGSNMDPDQMRVRGAPFTDRMFAVLRGYALKFNKKTTAKGAKPGEGKGNVVCDPKGQAEGALYEITSEGLKKLDMREKGYYRVELWVELKDGSGQKAWVYIAEPEKVQDGLKPSCEYLHHYLRGRDLLSQKYYEWLEDTETID